MSPSAVNVVGDVLVATERHSRLCRYDPATGEILWDVAVRDAHGVVVVGQGVVLYLDQAGTLTCFELEYGRQRWSVEDEGLSGHLLLSDSVVLLGGWRGYRPLGARDLATGRLRWRSDFDQPRDLHWPFLNGDSVLVSARGSKVVDRIDPTSGDLLGRLQIPEPVGSADHGAAFASTPSRSVICRVGSAGVAELDESEVTRIWQGPPDLGLGSPPFLSAGKLWATVANGVAVLDPETDVAEVVAIHEGAAPGFADVGNVVLVASRAGAVLALASNGTRVAQLNVSSRSWGLHQVSEDTAVIATKGEFVGVRYSDN